MTDQLEDPDLRYKFHLPVDFRCGLVFFELAQEDSYSKAAIDAIMSGFGLRVFFGGVILRGEGITMPHTGLYFR